MKSTFPKFKGVDPDTHFKHFQAVGLDLMRQMIALDPAQRISMR